MPALNWGDGEEGIDAGAEMSMEGLDPSTLAVRNPCPSVDQYVAPVFRPLSCVPGAGVRSLRRECAQRAELLRASTATR
eukprot:COSAG03_NODE_3004_length_2293_cov_31.617593_2_plen_79_part_00